jgi:hypothetical protein
MNMTRICTTALLTSLGSAAMAQDAVRDIRLVPGWSEPDGTYVAALSIALQPGWKTYWRSPGEGGIPPLFDWSGSDNLERVDVIWPTPEVYYTYGMRSVGYENQVVFPLVMTPNGDGPISAELDLSIGVCLDVCIPAEASLSVVLPRDEVHNVDAIARIMEHGPKDASAIGLTEAECNFTLLPDGALSLTATLHFDEAPTQEPVTVFEIAHMAGDIWIGPSETVRSDTGFTASARVDYFGEGAFSAQRDQIRISLLTPERVYEQNGC